MKQTVSKYPTFEECPSGFYWATYKLWNEMVRVIAENLDGPIEKKLYTLGWINSDGEPSYCQEDDTSKFYDFILIKNPLDKPLKK